MFADDRFPRSSGPVRLLIAVAWLLLLIGLWVWACSLTGGQAIRASDPSPFARLAAEQPPQRPALDPLPGQPRPKRLDMAALGLHAPVVERSARGGEAAHQGGDGAPPADRRTGPVRWDGASAVPGAKGVAKLTARTLPGANGRPLTGSRLYVTRADGSVAEFTVHRVAPAYSPAPRQSDPARGDAAEPARPSPSGDGGAAAGAGERPRSPHPDGPVSAAPTPPDAGSAAAKEGAGGSAPEEKPGLPHHGAGPEQRPAPATVPPGGAAAAARSTPGGQGERSWLRLVVSRPGGAHGAAAGPGALELSAYLTGARPAG